VASGGQVRAAVREQVVGSWMGWFVKSLQTWSDRKTNVFMIRHNIFPLLAVVLVLGSGKVVFPDIFVTLLANHNEGIEAALQFLFILYLRQDFDKSISYLTVRDIEERVDRRISVLDIREYHHSSGLQTCSGSSFPINSHPKGKISYNV
jgi:hypothetical protein